MMEKLLVIILLYGYTLVVGAEETDSDLNPRVFLKAFNTESLTVKELANDDLYQVRIGYLSFGRGGIVTYYAGAKDIIIVTKKSETKLEAYRIENPSKEIIKEIEALLEVADTSPVTFSEAHESMGIKDGTTWLIEHRNSNNGIISQVTVEGLEESKRDHKLLKAKYLKLVRRLSKQAGGALQRGVSP